MKTMNKRSIYLTIYLTAIAICFIVFGFFIYKAERMNDARKIGLAEFTACLDVNREKDLAVHGESVRVYCRDLMDEWHKEQDAERAEKVKNGLQSISERANK